jgi:peptidoglycan hydrolase-like protein with peptidoglycan-binding domain
MGCEIETDRGLIMANPTPTNADVQEKLKSLGLYDGEVDGLAGPVTAAAVVAFQKSKGLTETGKLDNPTLAAMFPSTVANRPTGIQATILDWVLNYAQSKIVWAAGALALVAIGWVQTKFGINLPPDVENTITSLLVAGGTALIAILRGWGKDTPRVTAKSPAVIQQPARFVGQTK